MKEKINLPNGKLYFEFEDFSPEKISKVEKKNEKLIIYIAIAAVGFAALIIGFIASIGLLMLNKPNYCPLALKIDLIVSTVIAAVFSSIAIIYGGIDSDYMLWHEIKKLNNIIKDSCGKAILSKDFKLLYYFSDEVEQMCSYKLPSYRNYHQSDDFKLTYDKEEKHLVLYIPAKYSPDYQENAAEMFDNTYSLK